MTTTTTLPRSTAQRTLDVEEPVLLGGLETISQIARNRAEGMTAKDLRTVLSDTPADVKASDSKATLVDRYVQVEVKKSLTNSRLEDLRHAARCDEWTDRNVVNLLERFNALHNGFTNRLAERVKHAEERRASMNLQGPWNLDVGSLTLAELVAGDASDVLRSLALARFALRYLRSRQAENDPADIAREMIRDLIQQMSPDLAENIRITGRGVERYEERNAAKEMLEALAPVLPADLAFLGTLY